jgi:hypothetical protein
MSHPVIRQASSPALRAPDGFTRNEGRSLARRQNAEVANGIVAATRVQAAALTAATGIQCVGMLSREATYQAGGDPVVMERVNHIVDHFAGFVGNEVARFGF